MREQRFGPQFHICSYLHSYGLGTEQDQQVWWTSGNETWSKSTLYKRVVALSTALTAAGVREGERVALIAPATCRFLESVLAITSAGAICAPVNTKWSASEVEAALKLTRPSLIIAHSSFIPVVRQALQHCTDLTIQLMVDGDLVDNGDVMVHVDSVIDGAGTEAETLGCPAVRGILNYQRCIDQQLQLFRSAQGGGRAVSSVHQLPDSVPLTCLPPLPLLQPSDGSALICFTSGTTGTPKGVVLSHAAFHTQSLVKLAMVGYCSNDVYLHLAPLYHIGGLSSAMAVLMVGGKMVFLPRYSAAAAYDLIRAHDVTAIIAVPTMLKDFVTLSSQSAGVSSLPSMRRLLVGAGSMPPPLQAAAASLFPNATISTAYGMSEACSSITFNTVICPAAQHANPSSTHLQQHPTPSQHHTSSTQLQSMASRVGHDDAASCLVPTPSHHMHVDAHHESSASRLGSRDGREVGVGLCSANASVAQVPAVLGQVPVASGQVPPASEQVPAASGQVPAASPRLPTGATQAGWPAPGILVRVVPESDGEESAELSGESSLCVGEVQTKGPHLMSYYWGNPTQTQQAFTPDGWLRTGDMGCIDPHGCLWLVGRKKDMIKSGGENVFAAEVEAIIAQHPAVLGVAVVGLPHERLGEQVCALVELRPGTEWQGLLLNYTKDGVEVRDRPHPRLDLSATRLETKEGRLTAPGVADCTSIGPFAVLGTSQDSHEGRVLSGNMLGAHGHDRRVLSENALRAHCRESGLSAYKLPRLMAAQYSGLPVNSSGKVLKHEVKILLRRVQAAVLQPASRL